MLFKQSELIIIQSNFNKIKAPKTIEKYDL